MTARTRPAMSQGAQGERMAWMDLLRGVAIVLVLLLHAPVIPVLLSGYDYPAWLRTANDALRPFRMPGLMLLSGLLLPRSLSKPLPTYLVGKLRLLVWPYVLWAGVFLLMLDPANLDNWRSWTAAGYLWFLAFVIYFYLLAPVLGRLPAWSVPAVMFVASYPLMGSFAGRLLYFGGFFFAGNLLARHPQVLEGALRRRWVVALCTCLAVAAGAASTVLDTEHDPRWAVGSLAGVVAAISAARLVGRSAFTEALRSVGRNSLVYYVAHFPVMLGVLALLDATGVRSLALVAVANLAVGLGACAVLARMRHRRPLSWLFQAPGRPFPTARARTHSPPRTDVAASTATASAG